MRVALLVVLLLSTAVIAGDRVMAGKWEATLFTDAGVDSALRTLVFCLPAEDAAALNADSKTGREFAQKKSGTRCTLTSYAANGDEVSYTAMCGDHTISDVTHYEKDQSHGVKTTTAAGKTTVTKVTSKRLGPCPSAEELGR